jgi:hypothetical protein
MFDLTKMKSLTVEEIEEFSKHSDGWFVDADNQRLVSGLYYEAV